jgi:hypothetical protein
VVTVPWMTASPLVVVTDSPESSERILPDQRPGRLGRSKRARHGRCSAEHRAAGVQGVAPALVAVTFARLAVCSPVNAEKRASPALLLCRVWAATSRPGTVSVPCQTSPMPPLRSGRSSRSKATLVLIRPIGDASGRRAGQVGPAAAVPGRGLERRADLEGQQVAAWPGDHLEADRQAPRGEAGWDRERRGAQHRDVVRRAGGGGRPSRRRPGSRAR